MKKKLILIVGLAFVAVLSWRFMLLVKPEEKQKPQGRPPVAVEIQSVEYAPIEEAQQFTGAVFPQYRYIIAPKVSGRAIEITKRIGDRVSKGEIIARIDDAEYQQAVVEAEADLKATRASLAETTVDLELAKQELERARLLQEKGIVALSELEKAHAGYNALESRYRLIQAQIEQSEAALTTAGIRLGYTVLNAAQPGYIAERYVDEGSMMAPNTPIVSVIGINKVTIRTTVIERLYGRMRIGQSTEIEVDAYPARKFHGTVARIAPTLQEASRVAEMEIEVENNALLLKPGMFAKVRIVLSKKDSAQIVPTRSVVASNGDTGVFVIDNNQSVAHYVPVQVGITAPEVTEILSPKIEGMVVTLGQHLLEEGSPVILPGPISREG